MTRLMTIALLGMFGAAVAGCESSGDRPVRKQTTTVREPDGDTRQTTTVREADGDMKRTTTEMKR